MKIYGVRALDVKEAAPFYEEISYRTGGMPIQFKNFGSIVQMFLAICYREASAEKLRKFQEEIKGKDGKEEGGREETEVGVDRLVVEMSR